MKKQSQHTSAMVMKIYELLLNHFGPRGWWPADTAFEVIVGAILTQAVAWENAARAINNLKKAGLLDIGALYEIDQSQLAELIVPALYHRQKARKLKNLLEFIISDYNGKLETMLNEALPVLRPKLLEVWGIGPETADSILLYAANHRIFVVDAYTRRIFYRLGFVKENIDYQQMQAFLHNHVTPRVEIYNEYHALIVGLGSRYCKKNKPRCRECPLSDCCLLFQKQEGKEFKEVE